MCSNRPRGVADAMRHAQPRDGRRDLLLAATQASRYTRWERSDGPRAPCYNNVQATHDESTMLTTLRKLGNSRGVIIPKPLLAQVGMTDDAVMKVEDGAIVLRPAKRTPREGWAEASRAVAADAEEGLAWPEFANEDDKALRW